MDPRARSLLRRCLRRLAPAALALAATLTAVAGCAHAPARPGRPRPGPTPPPATRPRPGYEALRDSLQAVDPAVLRGRRIVLDPGHGGFFAGSRGVNGLTEAAVNLDVALALRDLLVAAGAEVRMTRETDRDYLSPADSSLHADLGERVRIANAFAPELFVSVHHNADARGSHDVNEIQTYYKLTDDGPSLDAARAMHRALTRNLSIAAHRIIPGNYYVLRHVEAPAILTESSYLTNPDVEAKLASPEKRRLEAQALYLGIAGFFARGAPEIVTFGKAMEGSGIPADGFYDPYPWLAVRVHGAFDQVEMTVDGEAVATVVAGDSIQWRATRGYERGVHVAALRVGLAGAGWSATHRFTFRVLASLGRLVAEFPDQLGWDGKQPLGLRVQVLDANGLPYRDSVGIRVRDLDPRLLLPADTVITARDGVAWAYFRRSARKSARRAPGVDVSVEQWPPEMVSVEDGEGEPMVAPVTKGIPYFPHGLPARPEARPFTRTGFARLIPGDSALRDAPGTREPDPAVRWINRDGFVNLWRDSLGHVAIPALAGYRALPPDTAWPPRFVAIAGGALIGRRIALDPEGGGDADAGTGPSGARAADLNLDVARALAGFLTAAGAEVTLLRDGDRALADLERVRAAETFGAERYLRIGHRAGPPVLGYWFGSSAGRAWAQRTADALAAVGLPAPPVAEEAQYALQQASATALYASIARVDSAADEERLLAPGARRAEAYALYLALVQGFAPAFELAVDSLTVADAAGQPVADAAVTLGGTITLRSDARGQVRFARTEPGSLEAVVADRRVSARALLLDSSRGVVLTGPPTR